MHSKCLTESVIVTDVVLEEWSPLEPCSSFRRNERLGMAGRHNRDDLLEIFFGLEYPRFRIPAQPGPDRQGPVGVFQGEINLLATLDRRVVSKQRARLEKGSCLAREVDILQKQQ